MSPRCLPCVTPCNCCRAALPALLFESIHSDGDIATPRSGGTTSARSIAASAPFGTSSPRSPPSQTRFDPGFRRPPPDRPCRFRSWHSPPPPYPAYATTSWRHWSCDAPSYPPGKRPSLQRLRHLHIAFSVPDAPDTV